MRKYRLVSLESGILLGEILESIMINGQREFVVQHGSRCMFVKSGPKVQIVSK